MEQELITYCSPTLAGIKTANLFRYHYSSKEQLEKQIEKNSVFLNTKGVHIEILEIKEETALLLVYRRRQLQEELLKSDTTEFLKEFGYISQDIDYCLHRLKNRLALYSDFPHEIGVFLGYPLKDIQGFIFHKGENCKCEGVWKVYSDEQKAKKLFDRYKRCKNAYEKQFSKGKKINQLTVAA